MPIAVPIAIRAIRDSNALRARIAGVFASCAWSTLALAIVFMSIQLAYWQSRRFSARSRFSFRLCALMNLAATVAVFQIGGLLACCVLGLFCMVVSVACLIVYRKRIRNYQLLKTYHRSYAISLYTRNQHWLFLANSLVALAAFLLLTIGVVVVIALLAVATLATAIACAIVAYRSYVAGDDEPYDESKLHRPSWNVVMFITVLWMVAALSLLGNLTFLARPGYQVWDRQGQVAVKEFIPTSVATPLALFYAIPGLAHRLGMNGFFKFVSDYSGTKFSKVLHTDAEKVATIYNGFISRYAIDMSDYDRPDYRQYVSVNDWFTRHIKLERRPVGAGLVSAADSRVIVFPRIDSGTELWLKHDALTVRQLLGNEFNGDALAAFGGGCGCIHRLAPQDYHRIHAPVSGRIVQQYEVAGPLLSVSEIAIRSSNGAIYNKRGVTVIRMDNGRPCAVVAIGATAVGSIGMTRSVGDRVAKGDDLQFFQFGGSTAVLLFPRDTVRFDDDLVDNSEAEVETLVRQGEQIGSVTA